MASNGTNELLATIGAIQTLIENFPMGFQTAFNVKKYNSSLDFLLDALRTVGVNDQEIIKFVLEDLVGVNDLSVETLEKMDENDAKFQNNAFVQGLENAIKFLIAEILAGIVSCSVWPKIPKPADGEDVSGAYNKIDLPISVLDPINLFNVCPTTPVGMRKYTGIAKTTKPSELGTQTERTDLNSFMWYTINMSDPNNGPTWKTLGSESESLFQLRNLGYRKLRLEIAQHFEGKTLFEYNRKYLSTIHILSPKAILMNIIDELMNGLPNAEVNFGFDDIYTEAVFEKMIDTIVSNDDLEVNDCYYTFSNEDWNRMLENAELRKYNAKKYGKESSTAGVIDKDAVMESLDKASTDATLHDRVETITDALYDASRTVEYDKLVEEAGMERKWSFDYDVNSNWLYNILLTIIRPIVKATMTPKVMALLITNYEIAGALNLSQIDVNASVSVVFDFLKTKMLGLFAALVKKIKDMIVKAVYNFFVNKIMPLIQKYITARLLEQLEFYMDLLRQALDCIAIFGWQGRKVMTGLDEVNYADITPTKTIPNKSIC